MGKILVTGASGFTGKALCNRLVEMGNEVVAFVRGSSRTDELKKIGVECRVVDIKNHTDVKDNFSGIEKVYHIAAAWRTEHTDLEEFRMVNVEAVRNLLTAAKISGVKRFIHCSTVGVQGHIDDPPANEDYRFNPGDHYQRTKLQGEKLAREFFSEGLPGVVVRPAGIYGPGDMRFVKLFRPIKKGIFVMIGSGNTLYHFTYIDDLIDGFVLAGNKDEAIGEVFTVGGEKYISLNELVNMIADIMGVAHPKWRIPFYPVYLAAVLCEGICKPLGISPVLYPRRVDFFRKDRAFAIDKAKKVLGYKPKISMREGLEKTAVWYESEGLI